LTLLEHVIRLVRTLAPRRAEPAAPIAHGEMPPPECPIAAPGVGRAAPPLPVDGVRHALSDAYAPRDDLPPEMITLMLQLARDSADRRPPP
jgi:hypothetical protein